MDVLSLHFCSTSTTAASGKVKMNRYSIDHTPFDASQYHCVALKLCEHCGMPHITEALEALIPGDLLPMQRAAGHRAQIICSSCRHSRAYSLSFVREESAEILRIAMDLQKEREIRASREYEVHRHRKPAEIMHESRHTRRARNAKARERWAKWRIPLMQAFQEKQELTAEQIAAIVLPAACTVKKMPSLAVAYARNAGIPIIVLRTCGCNKKGAPRKVYGLSSTPVVELVPLQAMEAQA
jgi:hypothetical protein